MKKAIILVLLAVMRLPLLGEIETDYYLILQSDTIKGGYEQCMLYVYDYKYGEVGSLPKYTKILMIYNKKGIEIKGQRYFSDGSTGDEWENIYNEKGELTECRYHRENDTTHCLSTVKRFNNGKECEEITECSDGKIEKRKTKYNDKGDITEETKYNEEGSVEWKDIYTYNDRGKLIEYKNCFQDNSICNRRTYQYDDRDSLIVEKNYRTDGSLIFKTVSEYDLSGNLTKETHYKSEDSVSSYYLYKYDDRNRKIEETSFFADGRMYNTENVNYKEDGTRTVLKWEDKEQIWDDIGAIVQEYIHKPEYNGVFTKTIYKDDRRIEEISYNSDDSVNFRIKYIYDEYGNLTDRLFYNEINKTITRLYWKFSK